MRHWSFFIVIVGDEAAVRNLRRVHFSHVSISSFLEQFVVTVLPNLESVRRFGGCQALSGGHEIEASK